MFGALCDLSLPAQERTLDRLQDEGFSLISGGTETTTGTLKICMFHLLNDKTLLIKLHEELEQSPSSTWAELERLPYRRGVINEGLRLSGVITRLPRRALGEALKYKQWTVCVLTSHLYRGVYLYAITITLPEHASAQK
ncbi:hypothetical protein N7465_000343 [Penicillium sp. CMV-2018d]|nr:hypothetical protein N7465_000343 [Penicillium sp. CMV-2018d]